MKTFLVRGVPASIQQDSWWMDGLIQRRPPRMGNAEGMTGNSRMERPLLLVALIALADALLWGVAPGLSLAIFGFFLLLAALVLRDGHGWGGLILGCILFLPVIEQVQILSVMFWLAGLLMGGAWIAAGGWQGLRDTSLSAFRLLGLGPICAVVDLSHTLSRGPSPRKLTDRIGELMLGWTLPLGLGLVFASLLIEANPVVDAWLHSARDIHLPDLSRMAFWAGMGLMIWPFLRLAFLRQRLTPAAPASLIGPRRLPAILNPVAVRRSLFLFNALFAMQTGMDITYLWGGASLPEGMTYAQYAHRGAYPLLVTALLAGAFALIARPFADIDRLLRIALMIWLGQTILLVGSSILRLDLYVDIYGLTRLRLAAFIWMAVVAIGLGLTCWQVLRYHSAAWLLKRCTMLGIATLYLCMFFSFDRAIAHTNLTTDVPTDRWYICHLGSAALPEIRRHAPKLCDDFLHPPAPVITDWREWGFRDWRVLRSLAAVHASSADL